MRNCKICLWGFWIIWFTYRDGGGWCILAFVVGQTFITNKTLSPKTNGRGLGVINPGGLPLDGILTIEKED